MNDAVEGRGERDEVFGSLNRLNGILQGLDERGLVLSLAAFAEEALGDLIKSFLLPGDSTERLLDGFNAPIGTFSARSKMAYSLGLITKFQYEDLERLRRIRNEFAHSWEPLTFGDQSIAAHITALHFSCLIESFPESPQEKVRLCFGALLMELRSTTNQIGRHSQRAKVLGNHLVPGVVGTFDEQIAKCRENLAKVAGELKDASGERRRFLLATRLRWEGVLAIAGINAPAERKQEVRKLQAEFQAWNVPPKDY